MKLPLTVFCLAFTLAVVQSVAVDKDALLEEKVMEKGEDLLQKTEMDNEVGDKFS